MNKLENKVALVTGASSGIGAAIARLFAAKGAKLALASRSFDKLQALAHRLGPDVLPLQTDMTDPAQVRDMVRLAAERFGRIDILINNAGVGMYAAVADMSPELFQQLVATNWLGPVYAIQAALPYMREQGAGQIINISSVAGKVAVPWMAAYCASKFALNALSDSLRMELEGESIRVISVCPGRVRTPFGANAFKDATFQNAASRTFDSGGISAERVAEAVLRASVRGAREIVVPASNWGFVWSHALLPRLLDRMMARYLRRHLRKI